MNSLTRSLPLTLSLALGAWVAAAPAPAQNDALGAQVDAIFAPWTVPGSPGAAVVVTREGRVVHQQGYGLANLDYQIKITPATVFDIASVSKHFTAFAIAMLAEQGRLSLDDDVREHVPEVPDFGQTITIRHLIHHTSGIRDWVELLSLGGYRFDDVIAPTDIWALLRRQQALNFTPGAESVYSNTGYNILAEIVARVSGRPFAEYMEQDVFRPLGMTRTHILVDHQRVVRERAQSFAPNQRVDELANLHPRPPREDGSWRIWVDNTSAPGSSSVMTSIEDMAKWMRNFETGQVGGQAVIRRMLERGRLNDGRELAYAFGLVVEQRGELTAVSHGGSWRGFRTYFLWFPEERLAVTVLGNSTAFAERATAMRVAEVYLGDRLGPSYTGAGVQLSPPSASPRPERLPFSISPERLEQYASEYASAEVGTSYTVMVDAGRLVVRHAKMLEQVLTPVGDDRFITPGIRGEMTYTFERDAQGRVSGYRLAGARFRDVRFIRQTR